MKRRDFLHRSLHSAASASLFGSLGMKVPSRLKILPGGNPENDRVIVAIFLNGGNDSLNTVVQLDDLSVYDKLRPHVLLPENKLLRIPGHNLGLHPSLPGLLNMYNEGNLKIVRAVGYEDQNFSHFRSSDIWMSASDAHQVETTGWAGRYLNQTYPSYPMGFPNSSSPHPLAIELGFSNSLLFQGPAANMSVVINGERDFYALVEDTSPEPSDTLTGQQLDHIRLVRRQSQQYGAVIRDAANKAGSQLDYPNTELAGQLKIVARMIAGGLQTAMYKVELVGFDTHAGQVAEGDTTQGVHAWLLSQVDQAITAFMADLEHLGVSERVLGMTFSEFGRRIVSNSSLGTDHGSAGPLFFFGKDIGSGILGENYELDSGMTYEDNLPWQFDFRQVYGSALQQWLCVPDGEINQALLGEFEAIPVLPPSLCQGTPVRAEDFSIQEKMIQVHPNPMNADPLVEFKAPGGYLRIDLLDVQGRLIRPILDGVFPEGLHRRPFKSNFLPAGQYIVRLTSDVIRQAIPVIRS